MMYSEFIAGTGCKDNAHNYEVFKNLEAMYMNTEMTKAEIYAYGIKLVDNSKSEAELKAEAEIKAEIDELKSSIAWCKREIDYNEKMLGAWEADGDETMIFHCKNMIKHYKEEVKQSRAKIAALRHFFNL